MDGVLVDSEPLYFEVNREFMRRRGIEISAEDYDRYVGMSAMRMWSDVRERFGLAESTEELLTAEAEAFFRFLAGLPELPPMPGVRELLTHLQSEGLAIGLASSSMRKNVRAVLRKSGLEPFFDPVVCGEDVNNGKPAPDIFLRAAGLMRTPPDQCLVIEDSANGVRAAKAAGMACVGLRNPSSGNQDLAGADLIVPDFSPLSRSRILEFQDGGT